MSGKQLSQDSFFMIDHTPTHTDEILERLADGDESAFSAIYDRYREAVFQTAYRYLRSEDLAQDVVQEVFFNIWDKKTSYLHVKCIEAYLVTMTSHHVYRLFRKWATETKNQKDYCETVTQTVDDSDFSIRSTQSETLLTELLEKLPPQQKLVFTMAREQGMTHEAIAKELNLTQGTVKNHMVRALHFIRKNLSPYVNAILIVLSADKL